MNGVLKIKLNEIENGKRNFGFSYQVYIIAILLRSILVEFFFKNKPLFSVQILHPDYPVEGSAVLNMCSHKC